jgi:hypothetical protein
MKKHLFALASAVLLAPATYALEGERLAPVASGQPLLSGQAVATDGAMTTDGSVSYLDGGSGKHGCRGCDPCRRCVWVYGEYLHWWTRGDDTPTLLNATTTFGGNVRVDTFGGQLNDDYRQGFRAGGGFFPHCKSRNLGIEASWFSLGSRNDDGAFTANEVTTVGIPFFNAVTGLPETLLIGAPAQRLQGSVSANHRSRFHGGNVGFRTRLTGNDCGGCGGDCGGSCGGGIDFGGDCGGDSCVRCLDFQYGYQYYQLNETLGVRTSSGLVGANLPTTQFVAEDFDNDNQYHGGYLGLAGEFNCGKWFVGGNVRGGVGYMQQISRIRGSTTTSVGAVSTTVPFGQVFALPSNIGGRIEDEITWSGEVGVKIGYQPTCWFRTYVGYDFIYIDQTFRPGGAVDPHVNRAQLAGFGAGPAQPVYSPKREAFWAQGFTAGVELKF